METIIDTKFVDSTSHVMEPAYPGADEQVVSLYSTLNSAQLRQNKQEIVTLFRRCKCLQDRAARYIASAGALLADCRRTAELATDSEKLRVFANRLAARYLPRGTGQGRESVRLLSAVTPKGVKTFYSTIPALASTLVVIHDEHGASSGPLLAALRRQALERGYDIISCPCPLAENGGLDHLFVPQLGLAFLTSNSWHPISFTGQKNIHCTRFENKDTLRCRKKRLRFNRRAVADLLQQASSTQREAKQSHDQLEAYYGRAIDFAKVDEAAAALRAALGL